MKLNFWPISIIVFFVVVASVNITMLIFASEGYGGLLDQNPYEKGLNYQTEIKRKEVFKHSGLVASLTTSPLELELRDSSGKLVSGVKTKLIALRSNDSNKDFSTDLTEMEPGKYKSDRLLENGRWFINITLERQGELSEIEENIYAKAGITLIFKGDSYEK